MTAVRIVVIGHPGAGKTALIARAYAGLRRAGRLPLQAGALDRLRLRRIERRLAAGRPPKPTARPHAYRFQVRPPGAAPVRFSVHDRPGADLTGPGRGLLEATLAADAVIAVVDRADLDRGARHAAGRVRPLVVLIRRRLLREGPARVLPLVLAVTGGPAGPDELLEPFRPLQEAAFLGGVSGVTVWLRDGRPPGEQGGDRTGDPGAGPVDRIGSPGDGLAGRAEDCLLWCLRLAGSLPPGALPPVMGFPWPAGRNARNTGGEEGPWTGFSPSS